MIAKTTLKKVLIMVRISLRKLSSFDNGENGIDIDVNDCETSLKVLMMMTTSLKKKIVTRCHRSDVR